MTRSEQFFHGTTAAIKGGMVRPANDVDKHISEYSMGDPGDMSEGDHAFAIRGDENYAWHAASTFHKNGARPRVYEVEPATDMKPGPWNKEHPNFLEHHELDVSPEWLEHPPNREAHEAEVADAKEKHQDEWASPTGFKVRSRIDIMPGRQGTFPSVNWNSYRAINGGQAPRNQEERIQSMRGGIYDVNHPTDDQVKYGTKLESSPDHPMAEAMHNDHLSDTQFHDWKKDPAPHSILREEMGRPQKRWASLFD